VGFTLRAREPAPKSEDYDDTALPADYGRAILVAPFGILQFLNLLFQQNLAVRHVLYRLETARSAAARFIF
jgi:hypothetical protein